MAGFFGLFGGKTKYVDEVNDYADSTPQSKEAFYLSNDEAKTLGNIDFMRKPNTIKRSFPKTLNSKKGKEIVRSISSVEENAVDTSVVQPKSISSNGNGNGNGTSNVNTERRSVDSNLDMFRKMARDIKK
jgi:hypothetical protein